VWIVVLAIAGAALTVIALILLSIAIMVHFWDSPDRAMVAWIVAGTWVALWAITLVSLVSTGKSAGNPFPLTRRELGEDWRQIKERL
ncbi:phage holin family protein, partial [Salmonella enterica]|uniref:phage holin family protein n=2 Tax=Pseudomonadota TaxID=1224 RepID=UPI003527C25E